MEALTNEQIVQILVVRYGPSAASQIWVNQLHRIKHSVQCGLKIINSTFTIQYIYNIYIIYRNTYTHYTLKSLNNDLLWSSHDLPMAIEQWISPPGTPPLRCPATARSSPGATTRTRPTGPTGHHLPQWWTNVEMWTIICYILLLSTDMNWQSLTMWQSFEFTARIIFSALKMERQYETQYFVMTVVISL